MRRSRSSSVNRDEHNNLNLKLITNAASKAITNKNKNSLYKKEIFEYKDCNQLLTYQSLKLLYTCKNTLEDVISSFENEEEDNDHNVIMISSVIATLLYTFDLNNSKILKKRIQLLMCNKLVKIKDIFENDANNNEFIIDISAPDMSIENFDEYKNKFYNKDYQFKLLKSCHKIIENELYLINKRNNIINNKMNNDAIFKLDRYCSSLCNFENIYNLIPELAMFLEDFETESTQEHHLIMGTQILQNISVTIAKIFKKDISKYVVLEIMSFKDEHYLLHKIYFVLLIQLRYINILSNVLKQFYETNKVLLKDSTFTSKVSNIKDFENILSTIESLESKLMNPITNLVISFCVENSMIVNQSNNVIAGLKEKYIDFLQHQFFSLHSLIKDLLSNLESTTDDIAIISSKNDDSNTNTNSKEGKNVTSYFEQAVINNENGVKKNDSNGKKVSYNYNPQRMNSFEANKRNKIYRTSSDLAYMGDTAALNAKIIKSAGSLSSSSTSSSNASSRSNSLTNQSKANLHKISSIDSMQSNGNKNLKKDNSSGNSLFSKKLSRTRSSSVSSNSSTVKVSSKTSSSESLTNSTTSKSLSRTPSVSNGSTGATVKSRSRSSSFNNNNPIVTKSRSRSSSVNNHNGMRQLKNSMDNLSVTEELEENGTVSQKVRFTGVAKYPMKNEDPIPTRQGWYTKPAVLHYPMLSPNYITNITTIKQSPFNKLKQMEGFAFKHSNDLITQ